MVRTMIMTTTAPMATYVMDTWTTITLDVAALQEAARELWVIYIIPFHLGCPRSDQGSATIFPKVLRNTSPQETTIWEQISQHRGAFSLRVHACYYGSHHFTSHIVGDLQHV